MVVALFHYPVPSLDDGFYKIARYAHLPDYHLFMKEMLEELAASFHHAETAYKTTVDAGFSVDGRCAMTLNLNSNEPCPEEHLTRSLFSGFQRAIVAGNSA